MQGIQRATDNQHAYLGSEIKSPPEKIEKCGATFPYFIGNKHAEIVFGNIKELLDAVNPEMEVDHIYQGFYTYYFTNKILEGKDPSAIKENDQEELQDFINGFVLKINELKQHVTYLGLGTPNVKDVLDLFEIDTEKFDKMLWKDLIEITQRFYNDEKNKAIFVSHYFGEVNQEAVFHSMVISRVFPLSFYTNVVTLENGNFSIIDNEEFKSFFSIVEYTISLLIEKDEETTAFEVALDVAKSNFSPYKYGVEIAIDIIKVLKIEMSEEEILAKSLEELFEISKSKIALAQFIFGNDYKEGEALDPHKQADFENCKDGFFHQMEMILCGIKSSKEVGNPPSLLNQEGQNTSNGRTYASAYVRFLTATKSLEYFLSLSVEELFNGALKHFKIGKKSFLSNSDQGPIKSYLKFFKDGFIHEIHLILKEIRKQNPHFEFTQKAQEMSEDQLADLINSDNSKGAKVVEKRVISSKSKGKEAASEYFNNSPAQFFLNFLQFDEEKMDSVIEKIVVQDGIADKEKFAEEFKKHLQGIKRDIEDEKKASEKVTLAQTKNGKKLAQKYYTNPENFSSLSKLYDNRSKLSDCFQQVFVKTDLYTKLKGEQIPAGREIRVQNARGLFILKNAFIKAMDSYFNGNRARFQNQEEGNKNTSNQTKKTTLQNKKVNTLLKKFEDKVREKIANGLTENDLTEFKKEVIAQKVKLEKAREYFNAILETDRQAKEKGESNIALAETTFNKFKKIYKDAKLTFQQVKVQEQESILQAESRIEELQERLAQEKRLLDELKGSKVCSKVIHQSKVRKLSENEIKMFERARLKNSSGELIALNGEYTLEEIEILKICVLKILRGAKIIEGEQNKQYQRELATYLSTLMKDNEHTPEHLAFDLSSKKVTVEDVLKNAKLI